MKCGPRPTTRLSPTAKRLSARRRPSRVLSSRRTSLPTSTAKLFIHNLGHATAAYLGHLQGKAFIWECVEVPVIRTQTREAMWTAAQALIRRYPSEFDQNNLAEHIEDLLRRFANRALGDTVFRVGRDLQRKLTPDDRLIGALPPLPAIQDRPPTPSSAPSPPLCTSKPSMSKATPSPPTPPSRPASAEKEPRLYWWMFVD